MAVPGKNGGVVGTKGGAAAPKVSGAIAGATASNEVINADLSLSILAAGERRYDVDVQDTSVDLNPIYGAKKAITAGKFSYNAAKYNTWILPFVTKGVAGVNLDHSVLYGRIKPVNTILSVKHNFGVKATSLWTTNKFAWTGKLADGSSKKSRLMWLNANGTVVAKPSTLTNTYAYDIRDKNATDNAVDDAANPTREVPGEFTFKVDFVNLGTNGGNAFKYPSL